MTQPKLYTKEYKKRFIIENCMLVSVQAGLATRNKNFPIYTRTKPNYETHDIKYQWDNTSKLKYEIFNFLENYLNEISAEGMREEVHLKRITELADSMSEKFKPVLYDGRFRIGVSQKIINLFLKYMWSINEIPQPLHCPIDGIVKSHIEKHFGKTKLVDWTQLDNIHDYMDYISHINEMLKELVDSTAVWELKTWGRR
ncbi:hypothetical protein [Draconibacterium orientale]|uniref:hypothetical protein n=1 Tax=Draconibacterium orientale TaxID=1168034 RepID=UPI0029C04E11|nr:hypothetical protein [Draconibacterium orientale]